MTNINANMTDSVGWVPLADPVAFAPGLYTLGSESLEIGGLHLSETNHPWSAPNGRWCQRAFSGSTAASHLSGATLTRYYPEAPSTGGADELTADELAAVQGAASPSALNVFATMADAGGGAGAILTATVDLSAADIATLSSVPVEVVAAPGANKVIVPVAASFQFKTGAVAFDFASGDLYLGPLASPPMLGPEIGFNGLGDLVAVFGAVVFGAINQADWENEPVMLASDVEPDGAGDGTARITVLYYVMDLV